MNIIGGNLLKLRESLDLTQSEVADSINISRDYVSKIEMGLRQSVNPNIVKSLAMELNTTENWLTKNTGWAYIPATPVQAVEFATRQIKKYLPSEIIIVTYDDRLFGTPKGFVFIGDKGPISMGGRSIRTGYFGSSPTAYKDILLMINHNAKIKVGHVELNKAEGQFLGDSDLSAIAKQANYDKKFIVKELHELRPDDFPDPDTPLSIVDSTFIVTNNEMLLLKMIRKSKTDIQDLMRYVGKRS